MSLLIQTTSKSRGLEQHLFIFNPTSRLAGCCLVRAGLRWDWLKARHGCRSTLPVTHPPWPSEPARACNSPGISKPKESSPAAPVHFRLLHASLLQHLFHPRRSSPLSLNSTSGETDSASGRNCYKLKWQAARIRGGVGEGEELGITMHLTQKGEKGFILVRGKL